MDGRVRDMADSHRRRSARFAMRVPLFYRFDGRGAWLNGETANIGGNGMLFRGSRRLNPGCRIRIALSLDAVGAPAAFVVGRARIVRTYPSIYADGSFWLAATITRSRLLPSPVGRFLGGRRRQAPEVDGGTAEHDANSSRHTLPLRRDRGGGTRG